MPSGGNSGGGGGSMRSDSTGSGKDQQHQQERGGSSSMMTSSGGGGDQVLHQRRHSTAAAITSTSGGGGDVTGGHRPGGGSLHHQHASGGTATGGLGTNVNTLLSLANVDHHQDNITSQHYTTSGGAAASSILQHTSTNTGATSPFSSYIQAATSTDKSNTSSIHVDSKLFESTDVFNMDWRQFVCKTWHLEPTVRLLSWGGKRIEPYGVDYILQKLGFAHARTTIPKWMQRGFMDPLDKVLSVLVSHMLQVAKEEMAKNK